MTKREKIGVILAIVIGILIEGIIYIAFRFCEDANSSVMYIASAILVAILDGFVVWAESRAERAGDLPFDQ